MFEIESLSLLKLVEGGCYCYCRKYPVSAFNIFTSHLFMIGEYPDEETCEQECEEESNKSKGYYKFARCSVNQTLERPPGGIVMNPKWGTKSGLFDLD